MPSKSFSSPTKHGKRDSIKKLRTEFELARDLLSEKTNMLFKALTWRANAKDLNKPTDLIINTIYQYAK